MEAQAYIQARQRSALMSRVRRANTAPELAVRRCAHGLGYRFRLHRKDLPGTPDIVFPKARKVIFVHGCFWHRHTGCRAASMPKTRSEFWQEKFNTNIKRDMQKDSERIFTLIYAVRMETAARLRTERSSFTMTAFGATSQFGTRIVRRPDAIHSRTSNRDDPGS